MPRYATIEQFAQRFPADAAKAVEELGINLKAEILDWLKAELPARTPVDKGEMRAKWQSIPGRPSKPARIGNKAPHAVVIDRGRKPGNAKRGRKVAAPRLRGKRGRFAQRAVPLPFIPGSQGAAKMMGSTQAPQGIVEPALRDLEGFVDQVVSAAIAETERKVG